MDDLAFGTDKPQIISKYYGCACTVGLLPTRCFPGIPKFPNFNLFKGVILLEM